MTTTDPSGGFPPPAPPPAPSPASDRRQLRRSRTGRVGAGVASGLGEYFGLDPVLFRVLFATSAFFGGAGIIAYLLAWAAIPEAGTEHAPIDGFVARLRRRRVPVWLVAAVGGLLLWLAAFSWWAPGPFLPVLAVVFVLVVAFGRRDWRASQSDPASVSLTKPAPDASTGQPQDPTWVNDARSWFSESRAARRERRRRALPLRLATVISLVVTLIVLGAVDAVSGIALPVYFWTALGIVGTGLLAGVVLRRTPWSVATLLVPTVAGLVAFGGTHASLHDGSGERQWKPTGTPASSYRLAFGQGILDLRSLPTQSVPHTIDITMAAGQVQIIAPKSLNLTVLADIHIGQLQVDDGTGAVGNGHGGVGLRRTVDPPAGATGTPLTVHVHLASGNVSVDHR